jgi:hypothetical protein
MRTANSMPIMYWIKNDTSLLPNWHNNTIYFWNVKKCNEIDKKCDEKDCLLLYSHKICFYT